MTLRAEHGLGLAKEPKPVGTCGTNRVVPSEPVFRLATGVALVASSRDHREMLGALPPDLYDPARHLDGLRSHLDGHPVR